VEAIEDMSSNDDATDMIYPTATSWLTTEIPVINTTESNPNAFLTTESAAVTTVDDNISAPKTRACHIPSLNPYNKEITKFIKKPKPPDCSQYNPPMTYIENRTWIRINETAAKMYYPEDLSTQCGVIYFSQLVFIQSFHLNSSLYFFTAT